MCNRLRTTIPRARNRRVCDWCGQTIEAAERYVCATYLDEGGWRNTSMHPECDEDMCIVAAEEGGCIVLATLHLTYHTPMGSISTHELESQCPAVP